MANIKKIKIGTTEYDIKDVTSGYITGITSGDVTTALGYTPYDATNPDGYLQNKAIGTGTGSLTILGTATSQTQSTNVGISSVASSGNSTAFGCHAIASGGGSLAVGRNSVSSGNTSVALGAVAEARAQGALMIGGGVNSESQTLKVALRSSSTQATDEATGLFKLMNADGTIPPERHASVSSTAGDYYAKITVDSQGNATSSWGPAPTPSIDWTSISGYDATKKQILVNDQGTVKWVTAGYIE